MIYSSDHNFLLLKNIKVGGTSLEVDLSNILPNNAIITPIVPENKFHNPRNYDGFYNHMPYSEIKNKINLNNVKSYIFVRHPYNTVLSHFFHTLFLCKIEYFLLTNNEKNIILNKYFYEINSDMEFLKSTKYIYTENNVIKVDKILKYENGIENEINPILISHKINPVNLVTTEKQYRPQSIKYFDIFNNKILKTIQDEWHWEFDNLGYEY